jgi:hypothetical protein
MYALIFIVSDLFFDRLINKNHELQAKNDALSAERLSLLDEVSSFKTKYVMTAHLLLNRFYV